MPAAPGSIFICYRRDDSADVAGRIYDRLIAEFGKDAIYRDVDTIPFGEDFREHIGVCLASCRVGLVIIGPDWTEITGRSGKPRLHEPADHVRIEVEAMLGRREMKTIPLYVRGAAPPEPDALPESLVPIAYKNGADIRRDPDFHHDMDRVLAHLRTLVAPVPPVPMAPEPIIPQPPVPPIRTIHDPVPGSRERVEAAYEPVPVPPTPGSSGGRWWCGFLDRLPASRTWGWIWGVLTALTGILFFTGDFAPMFPCFGTVLLSPLAGIVHWRSHHRVAAIIAGGYFGTVILATFSRGIGLRLMSELQWLALTHLVQAAGWVVWSWRLPKTRA